MNNKDLIKEAKGKTEGIYGTLYLTNVLNGLTLIFSNIIPLLGAAVLCGPLNLGRWKIYIDVINGKKPNVKDIVQPFKNQWGPSFYFLIARFLYYFGSILKFVLVAIPLTFCSSLIYTLLYKIDASYETISTLHSILTVLISITVICLSLVLLISLCKKDALASVGLYILNKEPDLDGDQALKKSIKMMKGHELQFWKLFLSLFWYYILSILFLGIYTPIINYCYTKFSMMIYEGAIEKEIHEEVMTKLLNEEARKRKESFELKEKKLKEESERAKQKEEELNSKVAELEKQKKQQDEKNEKMYQNALSLVKKATSSDEYKFINDILESLSDYKDSKVLLEKYKKIENELKIQEDILNS